MAIQVDSQNNVYLGNCKYGNHTVAYSTINHLDTEYHQSNGADEVIAWFNQNATTNTGFLFKGSNNQATWTSNIANAVNGSITLGVFGFSNDPSLLNNRVVMGFFQGSNIYGGNVNIYNNTGNIVSNLNTAFIGDNVGWGSNRITAVTPNSVQGTGNFSTANANQTMFDQTLDRYTNKYVCGVATGTSVATFWYQKDLQTEAIYSQFSYACSLASLNTNNNYYNANYINQLIGLTVFNNNGVFNRKGCHYIQNTHKELLETDGISHLDATYTPSCISGSPTAKWTRRFPIYDNNVTLAYPMMGICPNLLLASGNYIIGQVVTINGATQPDSGYNTWIAVGKWGITNEYTILMRCYSSGLS